MFGSIALASALILPTSRVMSSNSRTPPPTQSTRYPSLTLMIAPCFLATANSGPVAHDVPSSG